MKNKVIGRKTGKTVVAAAVAAALGVPALAAAQTSTVQIYGTARVEYAYSDQGQGLRKVDSFSVYDSFLGVRGEEKLGGGLSTWFQCESTMDVTGQEGFDNGFCTRNSGVGFRGGHGNVWFGIWDTPMKIATGSRYRPLSTAGFLGNGNLLHNGVGGNVANGALGAGLGSSGAATHAASWSRRQINAINYHSPDFGGFQFMAQYSGTNESTGLTAGAAPTSKPRMYSFAGTYTAGPLYLAAAYERHKNYNPGIGQAFGLGAGAYRQGEDSAWALVGAYTVGPVRIGASYHDREYETADPTIAGANREMKGKAWALYGDWRVVGPHTLRAGYIQAGDSKGNSTVAVNNMAAPLTGAGAAVGNTGAKLYVIQYAYAFSKRTEVSLGYGKLDNEVNSRYVMGSPTARNTCQGAPAGCDRDQDAIVMGLVHRF